VFVDLVLIAVKSRAFPFSKNAIFNKLFSQQVHRQVLRFGEANYIFRRARFLFLLSYMVKLNN